LSSALNYVPPTPELEPVLEIPTPRILHPPTIEEFVDNDAPKTPHENWSGEETFWMCEEGEEGDYMTST
jgi:hypothetical protein